MIAISRISSESPVDRELRLRVRYATLRLADGDSPANTRRQVMALYGIDATEADRIVGLSCGVQRETEQVDTERGGRHAWFGGILCAGGIAMTSITDGNGPFMLTWGAIVVGAIWFVRGCSPAR